MIIKGHLILQHFSPCKCGMEYRMLPRAQCCCGLACACGVCVLGLCSSVLRNREIWGASFVFWPGSADCMDVCSGEADSLWCVWQSCVRLVIMCRESVWRDSAECCATVCERCDQWRRRQVCLCATGKTVLGVQRQDVNGEWGIVLRDVGSFYISGGSDLRTSPRHWTFVYIAVGAIEKLWDRLHCAKSFCFYWPIKDARLKCLGSGQCDQDSQIAATWLVERRSLSGCCILCTKWRWFWQLSCEAVAMR